MDYLKGYLNIDFTDGVQYLKDVNFSKEIERRTMLL